MNSNYINMHYPNATRLTKYQIIKDFLKSNEYSHWIKRHVNENGLDSSTVSKINYKILYTPSQYNMSYIINEYLDHVKVLKTLKGMKTPLTEEEEQRLALFFKINNWDNVFKSFIKNRKLYGDDFTGVSMIEVDGQRIPFLRHLEAKDVQIVKKEDSYEYIYETTVTDTERDPDTLNTTDTDTDVQLLFTKGAIIPYMYDEPLEDDIFLLPISEVPIIHLQYLKEEDSYYSEIPSLQFIDGILRLHRIETNIAEINDKSGAPQLFVLDGDVDPLSRFGARGIAYVSSSSNIGGRGCSIVQTEITNGLVSLYEEQDRVLDAVMSSANLLSPKIKANLAKSDSSKVVKFLSVDLVEELRGAYNEIAYKTKILWKLLFPNRAEELSLEVPLEITSSSLTDKTSFINGNVMLYKDMLKEQGKTSQEIEQYLEDMNQQIQLLNGDLAEPETTEPMEQTEMDGVDSSVSKLDTNRGKLSIR